MEQIAKSHDEVVTEVESRTDRRRAVAAAVAGNFVEWYEFVAYGVVAAFISAAFFPSDDPTLALLSTWGVYASSFLVRPIGGIILARIGDLHGRKKILFISIVMMSAATAAIGFLPTYAAIGVAAPLILVGLRLVQGLAAGGEMSGAVAFLYEKAPRHRQARTIGWLTATTFCASLTASGLAAVLSATMSVEDFGSYGWRVLFIVALPLGLIGFYIRTKVSESKVFERVKAGRQATKATPFLTTMRSHKRVVLTYIGFGALNSTGSYIAAAAYLGYVSQSGLAPQDGLLMSSVFSAAVVLVVLITGGLADRFGRRPVLLAGAIGIGIAVVPVYLLGGTGVLSLALVGALLFAVPLGIYTVPTALSIVELFPPAIRVTAGAVAYNFATITGGFAPFISVALGQLFGTGIAFAVYVVALALIATVVLLTLYRDPSRQPVSRASSS